MDIRKTDIQGRCWPRRNITDELNLSWTSFRRDRRWIMETQVQAARSRKKYTI